MYLVINECQLLQRELFWCSFGKCSGKDLGISFHSHCKIGLEDFECP